MSGTLRIRESAASFIRQMVRDEPAEMVIVVTGVVLGTSGALDPEIDWKDRSASELADMGRRMLSNLPPTLEVKYVIGMKELERVPREEVRAIDGVKCFIPAHLLALIGDREIVVREGALVFEPDPPPVKIDKPI
jgi:hypothetical protein